MSIKPVPFVGPNIPRTELLRRNIELSGKHSIPDKIPSGFNEFSQRATDITNSTEQVAAKPSFFSKLKPSWLKLPKFMQGTVGDIPRIGSAIERAEGYMAKVAVDSKIASFKPGFTGTLNGIKSGIAGTTTSLLGRSLSIAKSIPLTGVAISGLLESFNIAEGFKEKRGAAQIMKSGSVVSGTTVGSVIGGALGSFAGPAGTWIGGAAGAMVGSWAGEKLGSGLWGDNKKGLFEKEAVAAAPDPQEHAPAQFGTMTGAVAEQKPFDINDPMANMPSLV